VHDIGTLVVSLRNRGMTIGEIAGRVINRRTHLLFLFILLFALWIVLAIFGLVIANVFVAFPESILPVFLQIPIAVWIGVKVHRRGGNLLWPSIIALGLMYLTVWFGAACPGFEWTGGWLGTAIQSLNQVLSSWPVWVWAAILLAYCYFASVMPVWVAAPATRLHQQPATDHRSTAALAQGEWRRGKGIAATAPARRFDETFSGVSGPRSVTRSRPALCGLSRTAGCALDPRRGRAR